MAARKLNMFEKIANNLGVIYRYQASQFPRRYDLLVKVAKRELAPPMPKDWPLVKSEFAKLTRAIESEAYKQLTVREGLVYAAVAAEIIFWFFFGEMIGRRYHFGYRVPASYINKDSAKKAKNLVVDDKSTL